MLYLLSIYTYRHSSHKPFLVMESELTVQFEITRWLSANTIPLWPLASAAFCPQTVDLQGDLPGITFPKLLSVTLKGTTFTLPVSPASAGVWGLSGHLLRASGLWLLLENDNCGNGVILVLPPFITLFLLSRCTLLDYDYALSLGAGCNLTDSTKMGLFGTSLRSIYLVATI